MIIKSAARTLRQPDAGADAREEAVQDIDQEVVRLNRIVSEVLDYAKPITFTWQDADPNAICREAAQAVQAAGAGVGIGAVLAPGLSAIRTDPERLRTVLVNVLHERRPGRASRAGRRTEARPGPLERRSRSARRRRAEGGVIVVVHDEGPGIDPAVAARCSSRSSRPAAAGRDSGWRSPGTSSTGSEVRSPSPPGRLRARTCASRCRPAPAGEAGDGRS